MQRIVRTCIIITSLACCLNIYAQNNTFSLNSTAVTWQIYPADNELTAIDLANPRLNTDNWVTATVPGTVFGSYVEQGLEPTPEFGDNIYQVEKSKYQRDFWYRTSFNIPQNFINKVLWLNFEGINHQGIIYLNGQYLGSVKGFYQPGRFDITALARHDKENILTVRISPPTEPIPNYASPTYISSAGWDWMPYVPGLLGGITDDIFLSATGPIQIIDPWVRTMQLTDNSAELSVEVQLQNSSNKEISGTISGEISPGNISFSRQVKIPASHFSTIKFDAGNDKELNIEQPRLWWPNGYGDQPLYNCNLSFTADDQLSDSRNIKFGIRKYSYDTDNNVLHISINGKPIFLKGGNWGMSEYMLRCRGTQYDIRLRLHKEMNYNMIRNWIGSTTDEEFYQACDKYGIMVWDDFWLNSHNNLPRDVHTFNLNAVEKIKRLRNYACIALWCGDNEGYPLPPINNWLAENIAVYDGNDRHYQPRSNADALTGSGVWTNLEPAAYFASPPMSFGGERGWGLRSEIGTAVFTNFESFKKFMPREHWWPQNEMWNKHFFGPLAGNAGPDQYSRSIEERYGKPSNIEDFCKKAQLLNIETNKAMYEGWASRLWNDASGILIWMSQSAYPSFVWQTYDYYFDLTGAFWGAKKGCEPVHIFWDSATNNIGVVNATLNPLENLTATAAVYNTDGKEVPGYRYTAKINVPANSTADCFTMRLEDHSNLAFKRPATASSALEVGDAGAAFDGGMGSRWGSDYSDQQWICVDLGKIQPINEVILCWEAAYASAYKLQISDDAENWTNIYSQNDGKGGNEKISLDPVNCRFVRMLGEKRATMWGYSLWEFKVYNKDYKKIEANPLSPVHFIRLNLSDEQGRIISDNFYWRGKEYLDYKALNDLQEVKLDLKTSVTTVDNYEIITSDITCPADAPNLAFALRVMPINARTGEQILPVFMNDNYFSLMPGESKQITTQYDPALLNGDKPQIIIKQYAADTFVD